MGSGVSKKPAFSRIRPPGINEDTWKYLKNIQEILDQYEGLLGDDDDKIITRKDLKRLGIPMSALNTDIGTYNFDILNRKFFSPSLTCWDDQQVTIGGVRLPSSGVNPPTWTAYKGSQVLAFTGSSTVTPDNIIYFTMQLTHQYKYGSDIYFHIHYVPENNTAGTIRWNFTHSFATVNSAFPSATTVTVEEATPEVTDQHTVAALATIDGSTIHASSGIFLCSLERESSHANDTYDNLDIYLVGLDAHVEKDSVGSTNVFTKQY